MANSLLWGLAVAAGHMATCRAALHPHGGAAHNGLHTVEQPAGRPGDAALPSHHMTQAFSYSPAIHVSPPHDAPWTSAAAANVSTPATIASLATEAATNTHGPTNAGSDALITEIVTSYTTYCPRATAITVNNVTYSANASAVLTVSHCPSGCRITRAASEVSGPTVTAVVSQYTTSLEGPTTLSLQGTVQTVTNATVFTVSRCPGGCTVTTDLRALISSARPAQYSPHISLAHGVPVNATISTPVTAAPGTGGPAGTSSPAAGPASYASNSTAPAQQTQVGGATGRGLSYATVVLACLVMLI